ncbi:MAG TPA: GNAT family acetyltransferase [Candidatus Competibacter sp.]|nr:GNAT family acetyltransferase [Candidatus Competibacter sp.]HRX61108.1 GNAT family acetyltransferase [Candidatus Competibacter sp.]
MSHTIRPFTEADTSAVVDLWKLCDLTRPWNDPTKDITRKLTVQPELFLLAEQEGRIIGSVMAGYEGHRGWINYLAVHPDYRRAGLGRQLMAAAEKRLLSLGCPKINLQVRTSNAAAIGFYQSIGFAQDEVVSYGKRLIPD